MNLDAIRQNAKSIAEALKLLEDTKKRKGSTNKSNQLKIYISQLAKNIQKRVDEERENV